MARTLPTVAAPKAGFGALSHHRARSLEQLGFGDADWDLLVALAGNPNTGKSTVFNALTGLRQHTGNWPGKTVTRAEGSYAFEGDRVRIVDLPGTYSLQAGSVDEEVARDFILFGRPDVTVVVLDATRLERNLNLALQVMAITRRVVICLNLMDEARRHGIAIDADRLSGELGVPVVATVARAGEGIDRLLRAIHEVGHGHGILTGAEGAGALDIGEALEGAVDALEPQIHAAFPGLPNARWVALRLLNADSRIEEAVRNGEIGQLSLDARPAAVGGAAPDGVAPDAFLTGSGQISEGGRDALRDTILETASQLRWTLPRDAHDQMVAALFARAEQIAGAATSTLKARTRRTLDATLDRLLTGPWTGFPVMLLILMAVFWLTIAGANVPSAMLATLLVDGVHPWLNQTGASIGMPWWLSGFLFDGVYLATAWVISVMLPPMAIFFPLFTLLEDFGYLPRVAFNLDGLFRRAGAHGKQALTMAMGFGCNAAGVVATRIIDSPRERLIAIITNNFSLCNGRWPTQILLASLFIGTLAPAHLGGLVSASAVVGIALLGVLVMFVSSWLLSHTMLKGEASTFSLELPPYRPPRVLQTLYTSLIDRTLIVLWRAIVFAAPAGAVIWLSSNVQVGGASVAEHIISGLSPFGLLVGLNGVVLFAYIVAIPANEIVIPTILMLTVLVSGDPSLGAGAGVMFEGDSAQVEALLRGSGWTLLTAVNVMLFSLLHNPCSTTLYTIYRETGSTRWTVISALLPIVMGLSVTFVLTQIVRWVQL